MREEPAFYEKRGMSVLPTAEKLQKIKLYVNQSRDQYVNSDAETAEKIDDLLHSQKDINSDDTHTLLEASDKIQGANCHKTALYLTDKITREDLFEPNNTDPQYAGHEQVEANTELFSSYEEFKNALMRKSFPVRISFFKPKDGKENYAHHSITILGFSNKKTLIGFEKAGPYSDTPFRYINALKAIHSKKVLGYTPGIEA